ncbi:unannotated protein [freshwater metagenome]|uniref:Unannotated protein n=1 Tax=freshwater metagenome TaxID=449393 RepID=A0A6J6E5Y8_9ZZZZ
MDFYGASHPHVLGAFHDLVLDFHEVRSLKGFESEVVYKVIAVVIDLSFDRRTFLLDDAVVFLGD